MCSIIPGSGRRGRRFRCEPGFLRFFTSPASCKRRLHPRVAELDPVLFAQLLVKVPHVEVEVLLPVQLQHLLQFSTGTRFGLGACFR